MFGMWGLILVGGGIAVTVLGPFTVSGFGEFDMFISSIIKAIIAIILVIIWILILTKLKNWIFKKEIKS
jgi:amino acid permease